MEAVIKDGKGKNGAASVSVVQRLNVSAKTNPRTFYISRDDGLAFNYTSKVASAVAGDMVAYIKNTSTTRNLFIKTFEMHAANDAEWTIYSCTGTAAGTEVTPANLNLGSGLPSETLAFGDAAVTGLTTDRRVGLHRTSAGSGDEMRYEDALILPPNTAICVEYTAGTTGTAEVDIHYHFENIGAS